jgi:hypothetical protein
MILIYSEKINNRLSYTCKVIFELILEKPFELTDELEKFEEYDGVKFNYSKVEDLPGIQIWPSGLLAERGLKEQKIDYCKWGDLPALFPTSSELPVPFDLFSSAFYLITRYEEYLPHASDEYGRFKADLSIAYEYDFLHLPIIDLWAYKLRDLICSIYASAKFQERQYKFISTIDIDSAFAYRHKGLVRTLGGFAKDVSQLDLENFTARMRSLLGKDPDPFDTYEELQFLHDEFDIESIYFFLLADYGHNDKNVSVNSRPFQSLIKSIADHARVGIHPGFMSNYQPEKLPKEVSRLSQIVKREITVSRQHFLMLQLPKTYRKLIKLDIKEDYTMGFAQRVGFRAGTCTPFPFYDLDQDFTTKLMLYPFAAMDATLNFYMELTPDEAYQEICKLSNEVRKVNGTFISLWHNESLSDKWHWKGWKDLYQRMIMNAREHEEQQE